MIQVAGEIPQAANIMETTTKQRIIDLKSINESVA
jgi:hypothetical protein